LGLVLMGTLAALLAFTIVLTGLASGTWPGLAAGLAPFLMCVPGAVLAHRVGWSRASALGVPFLFPVFIYMLLNSTWVTLRQGGVRWRETLYPLEALKAGNVR